MSNKTKRDSLPILKDRVSLSPELIKTKGKGLVFAFETEENTVKKTLEEAVRRKANLQGANLQRADLLGADLQWAKMDKKG